MKPTKFHFKLLISHVRFRFIHSSIKGRQAAISRHLWKVVLIEPLQMISNRFVGNVASEWHFAGAPAALAFHCSMATIYTSSSASLLAGVIKSANWVGYAKRHQKTRLGLQHLTKATITNRWDTPQKFQGHYWARGLMLEARGNGEGGRPKSWSEATLVPVQVPAGRKRAHHVPRSCCPRLSHCRVRQIQIRI